MRIVIFLIAITMTLTPAVAQTLPPIPDEPITDETLVPGSKGVDNSLLCMTAMATKTKAGKVDPVYDSATTFFTGSVAARYHTEALIMEMKKLNNAKFSKEEMVELAQPCLMRFVTALATLQLTTARAMSETTK